MTGERRSRSERLAREQRRDATQRDAGASDGCAEGVYKRIHFYTSARAWTTTSGGDVASPDDGDDATRGNGAWRRRSVADAGRPLDERRADFYGFSTLRRWGKSLCEGVLEGLSDFYDVLYTYI
jgi:hypothetical protein